MRFNFRSQVLSRYIDVTIVLPTDELSYIDRGDEKQFHPTIPDPRKVYKPGMKFQTIYLIHGGGDDDTLTYRYTNVERFAQKHHVMLVTPNIANSFGADANYGVAYSTFLTQELPVVIQSLFPSSPKREDNFIMGYAMGGNVAMGNAIMHPERYAACVDLSGGIGFTFCPETMVEELTSEHFKTDMLIYRGTFGDGSDFVGSRHDLVPYVKKYQAEGVAFPALTVICGSKEFIRRRVESDVAAMKALGLQVNYICAEGYDHDFDMWEKYIPYAMDELLPLKNAPIYPE